MRRILAFIPAAVALLFSVGAHAQTHSINGVWRNPKNSVHVDLQPCGPSLCGHVVWANAKAQADARKGGTENLIGLQLLRDFELKEPGLWHGRVFVPDLKATFRGTAQLTGPNAMRAKGCLIGNILCKSQLWTRVEPQPAG